MAGRDLTESQIQELLLDDDSDNDSTCSDDSVRDPDWNFPNSSGDEDELPNQDEENAIHSRQETNITVSSRDLPSKEVPQKTIIISETERPQVVPVIAQTDEYKRIIWKNKSLILPQQQLKFRGKTDLPGDILELETPYAFFRRFFSDDLLERIVEQTILYSIQVDPNKPLDLTVNELRKFLGICCVMSYIHVPSTRDYWSTVYGNEMIRNTMASKRFEKIRQFLQFNDNTRDLPVANPDHDRLHKVRPVIEHLRVKFAQVPFEESMSVDEQICATKARSVIKQYLPSKPHKWGYKIYVLCGLSGYAYDFEIYTGQENNPNLRLPEEPDLGASSNIVVRLSRKIEKNVSHKIYFDNYFTSMKLMVYLARNGILALGTVRRNRIPNSKMPAQKEMKSRGNSIEMTTTVEDVEVSCVAWLDNKQVMLMSSFAGRIPLSDISRYDRKMKQTTQISCPNVVKIYNQHMGGVDLLDSHMGRHRNKMRSKKWYMRIFYHMMDVTIINAWLLFKAVHNKEEHMRLADFRALVAEALCKADQLVTPKRGRPSDQVEKQLSKKRRGPSVSVPVSDVRNDRLDHWPEWRDSRQRCRLPNCGALTFVCCTKCGNHLCFNKGKNCFQKFHGV